MHWSVAGRFEEAGDVRLTCRDGDPVCDTDGVPNGVCSLAVATCVDAGGCAEPVSTLAVRGHGSDGVARAADALVAGGGGARCAAASAVTVPAGRRRQLRVDARSGAGADRDRLRLACQRAGSGGGARALVVATDFETGELATTSVARPRRSRTLDAGIHADAVVRVSGGIPFVLNRFLGDSVQRLDPSRGFRTRYQCSTGAGSNPHDIAVVAPDRAYVTRYDRPQLWVVDPSAAGCEGFQRDSIDLSDVADADGLPEMSQMAVVGSRLFVSVQRLDRRRGFLPTGPSRLLVLDASSGARQGEIVLSGANAFGDSSGIVVEPGTGRLLVGTPGDLYTVGDGGIVRVDPVSLAAEPGFVVTEDAIGGNVTDFVLVSSTSGFAVVQAGNLQNRLVAFDPSGAAPPRTLFAREAYLPDVALAPDGTIWLADQSLAAPGIRRFDVGGAALGGPLDVGLPPFSLGFVP